VFCCRPKSHAVFYSFPSSLQHIFLSNEIFLSQVWSSRFNEEFLKESSPIRVFLRRRAVRRFLNPPPSPFLLLPQQLSVGGVWTSSNYRPCLISRWTPFLQGNRVTMSPYRNVLIPLSSPKDPYFSDLLPETFQKLFPSRLVSWFQRIYKRTWPLLSPSIYGGKSLPQTLREVSFSISTPPLHIYQAPNWRGESIAMNPGPDISVPPEFIKEYMEGAFGPPFLIPTDYQIIYFPARVSLLESKTGPFSENKLFLAWFYKRVHLFEIPKHTGKKPFPPSLSSSFLWVWVLPKTMIVSHFHLPPFKPSPTAYTVIQ